MERLLVRLPNWLGDALMARPALHALRAAHPGARTTAVGPAALLELLRAERAWDDEEPLPAGPGLAARLRARQPEAALVLPPSFSSALLAWRSGARVRVGFAHEGRSPLLTRALPRVARGDAHLSREYLALAGELGAREVLLPLLAIGAAARAAAAALRDGGARAPYAILAPGAAYGPAKRWEAGRFASLGRRLAARGLQVLACGGAGDRAVCDEVAGAVGGGALSLAGRTGLGEQAALCADAAIVISNDSGLAHLAGATGAPTVAVFGSTSSAWTAPLGPRVRVVQRAPVCAPCFRRTCAIGTPCLGAIEVAAVDRAAREVAA
jgi:heptosyltransferase II